MLLLRLNIINSFTLKITKIKFFLVTLNDKRKKLFLFK